MAEKEASKAPSSIQPLAEFREGQDLFKRMFPVQNSSSVSKDDSQLSFKKISYIRRLNETVRRHWNPVSVYVSLNPLAALGIVILLCSMLFVMFPQIDMGVSRFFTFGTRFYLSENPLLLWIRDANRMLPYIVLPIMIVLLAARPLHSSFRSMTRRALFVVLSYVLGSAITVQVFKNFFSRARPRDVIEFGGTLVFTPAWQFASVCERNCSFLSGEAASAAAFLAILVFVPRPYRMVVAAPLVPLSIIVALNRVAFGAHFLSDALLGWLIVLWLMLWLYRKMGLDPAP
ncbi:phosphatase PAP2 family protein [Rhizobium sp. FKL33]|uniref:phosphatase PAP2 family protein n=1 Tax=Rhizobium sp. FKL33 TaxID=2562307 RepID=UPI0010BF8704|nr:phosphatase PAP2 family protein [Rhizobium sp. FKL33]